ncbi:MAG: MtaA/CmuA family methyltransferase [Candidatus Heimdallarchaeota archaeon]
MKEMTPRRRVLAALLGGNIDRQPVTSLAGCGGTVCMEMLEQTGLSFPVAHINPNRMADLAIASYELTGLECIRVPFDFAAEVEAFGAAIKWSEDPTIPPSVKTPPFKKLKDVKVPENFLGRGRISTVLEAITLARKRIGDFLPISSLVLGPFTLTGELVGIENLMRLTIDDPVGVKDVVQQLTETSIEYGNAQYRAGSDVVQIAEPVASSSMISPRMFREFVKPQLRKIAGGLGGPKVLHICGEVDPIVPDMVETGFEGISVEESVDIKAITPIKADVKLLGNVSSKYTLPFGTPADVKMEAQKALESGVDLLEPGCGIPLVAPIANIKALVEAGKTFKPKK